MAPELDNNNKPLGYQTLFVNSKETQILPYKYGIPLTAPLRLANDFSQTTPPPTAFDVSNQDINDTDLLRYNLGKFFFKIGEQYKFVDPKSVNVSHTKTLNPNKTSIITDFSHFRPPLRYFIGVKSLSPELETFDYGFLTGIDGIQEMLDLQNLEIRNTTFIALILDFDEQDSKKESRLGDRLKYLGANITGEDNEKVLFNYYLSKGKTTSLEQNASPQYLGLQQAFLLGTPGALPPTSVQKFLDHTFTYSHPHSLSKQDDFGSIKVLYSNVIPEYNFYQESYEKSLNKFKNITTNDVPNELYLPNLYTIIEETKTDFEEYGENLNYRIHSTLNYKIEGNSLRTLKNEKGEYSEVKGRVANQYLDEWSRVVNTDFLDTFSNLDLAIVADKYKNLIFSPNAVKNNEVNTSKAVFPFYNEITFNTDTSNKIADILSNSKLFDILVLDYIWQKEQNGDRMFDINFHTYQDSMNTPLSDEADENLGQQIFNLKQAGDQYKAYDFDKFVEEIKNLNSFSGVVSSAVQGSTRSISANGEEFSDSTLNIFESDPLTRLIYKMTFLSNYASVVKENLRNYQDIVNGKSAYSETLFYRVEKRDINDNLVQNFYVLNDSELIDVNLIDTQVIYGKNYKYQIFAVQLIIGNEYFYVKGPDDPRAYFDQGNPYLTAPGSTDTRKGEYTFNLIADTKQSVKLIEIPYTSPATIKLQEAPPVPPNINFVPYVGVDNEILITFNTGVDEYYDTYIPILEEDFEIIENSSITNNKNQTLFKSEGDATGFDMFRISAVQMPEGPESYTDFGIPGLAKRVTLNRNLGDPTFIDRILPNTKYWYTFRTNDKKHLETEKAPDFSNPTVVYQIEMVNNEGAIYLIVETYDVNFFNSQKIILEKQKTKTMRKYLRITPSFDQSLINTTVEEGGTDYYEPQINDSIQNYVENNLNEDVSGLKIGYRQQSVFGNLDDDTNNRFKIRLTSKKTGRKIDIFLRFKKPTLEK